MTVSQGDVSHTVKQQASAGMEKRGERQPLVMSCLCHKANKRRRCDGEGGGEGARSALVSINHRSVDDHQKYIRRCTGTLCLWPSRPSSRFFHHQSKKGRKTRQDATPVLKHKDGMRWQTDGECVTQPMPRREKRQQKEEEETPDLRSLCGMQVRYSRRRHLLVCLIGQAFDPASYVCLSL